jgi:hypothetical protein
MVKLQPWCHFMEWMDEVKFSPTPSPELHEEYQARRDDEEVERNARRRHIHEDLIWCACLEIEEYNLNWWAQTFVKHIYVDMNADVIIVRLRFLQQD